MTLAVALLYVWLISVGGRTILHGLRHLVDRKDRRDLSIFQIGLRFIERILTNTFTALASPKDSGRAGQHYHCGSSFRLIYAHRHTRLGNDSNNFVVIVHNRNAAQLMLSHRIKRFL